MENCASSFALLQKEKECLEADSCPSTTGSSIFLLPCAITWTIFSQGLLARAFTYALLPSSSSTVLLYQSSVGFPPFFRTSHQSQTMNQLGTTYLSETLQKREDFFFYIKPDQVFWITAGVYRTVFWVTILDVILRIMKDLQRAQEAQV